MTEYVVLFATKVSAKSKSDMERKSEAIGETLSKALRKKVYPHSYGIVEKKDVVQSTLEVE